MEGKKEIAKRNVIKSYFNFGKAQLKTNPKRTAQTLVNKEVRNQLPDSVSDDALRKRKEKVFELFNEIDGDKIYKIKSFSALTISKLTTRKNSAMSHVTWDQM
jgi:hypothetical protein